MAETGNGKSETKVTIDGIVVTLEPAEKKPPEPPEPSPSSQSSGCLLFILFLIASLVIVALVMTGESERGAGESPREGSPVRIQLATGGSVECEPGIRAGGWVKVVANARVRSSPGYRGKDDTIHFCKSGDRLLVLGGATEKDELCWWHVRGEFSGKTVEGWIADRAWGGIRLLKPLE